MLMGWGELSPSVQKFFRRINCCFVIRPLPSSFISDQSLNLFKKEEEEKKSRKSTLKKKLVVKRVMCSVDFGEVAFTGVRLEQLDIGVYDHQLGGWEIELYPRIGGLHSLCLYLQR